MINEVSTTSLWNKAPFKTLLLLLFMLFGCNKKVETTNLEKGAERFVHIISVEKDINAFAALYKDTVLYSDPVWGVTNEKVPLDTLRTWFEPVFDPETGWDFEIETQALDVVQNMFAIKGTSIDKTTGERRLITSWFKIENGKIAEQTDLTPWSLESLRYSPRFEEALKNYRPDSTMTR